MTGLQRTAEVRRPCTAPGERRPGRPSRCGCLRTCRCLGSAARRRRGRRSSCGSAWPSSGSSASIVLSADRADSWHRAKQVLLLAPGGAVADRRVDVVVCPSEGLFEPVDVLLEALLHSLGGGDRLPILLHRQHVDELPAATQILLELLRFRRRQRSRLGANSLGESEPAHVRRCRSVFARYPGRFREVPHLTRVDHRDGDPSSCDRSRNQTLVSARSLRARPASVPLSPQPLEQSSDPSFGVFDLHQLAVAADARRRASPSRRRSLRTGLAMCLPLPRFSSVREGPADALPCGIRACARATVRALGRDFGLGDPRSPAVFSTRVRWTICRARSRPLQ